MQPLTICMFSNLYPPLVSGSSTQTSALARELVRRGHKVFVITAHIDPNSPEYEENDGVMIHRLPALKLPKMSIALNFPWLSYTFTPSNIRRIELLLKQHKPDVIHLHNHMFDLGLSAALMRKRTGIPLVTTLHTVIRHSQAIFNLVLLPADRLFLRRMVINRSDQLICPDFNIKRYSHEAFGRSDSVIIPYGIDNMNTPDEKSIQQLRDLYKLNGKRVILSLGHVHAIRNRQDLIEAMPHILQAFPDTVLLVIGAVTTNLPERLARNLGVDHAIVFSGPVSHSVIPELLSLSELEAHWLNQEEPERTSLGIASMEAMLGGKVVLAAANPETYGPGLLKNGENIIIVEPGKPVELANTIIGLLADDARRREIGQRAQSTIRDHFSWDSICDQTVGVYRSVIEKMQ